ncbi:hypothetical protein CA13_18870 [Planctomycetes bacterium CA13]|uniref:Uncharacterized protein n=1 Tax=Novipirellula herctigrandis TaxID=2527986 RepID=A0A5C5YZD8_9BACT|nr:hypothetical protein CA13_18870 [Planctomycetes bacterium CA13]
MALNNVQPAEQVRKLAKLLGMAAIRLKRGQIAKSLESSREIGESTLEISSQSVITVSRGNDLATGETGCSDGLHSKGDPLERKTTRSDRDHFGAGDSTNFGQEGGEVCQTENNLKTKRRGGDK